MTDKEVSTATRDSLFGSRQPMVYTHCRIEVLSGGSAGRVLETEKDLVRIGSAPGSDLVIQDPAVSRNHVELRRRIGQYVLADVGSTNGTFIGDIQVTEATLRTVKEISLGDTTTIRFVPLSTEVRFEPSGQGRLDDLVGDSVLMREVFFVIERVAPTDLAVLITGGTGTGKEPVTRAVHNHSRRKDKPLVTLAAGSLPPALLESALFGHEAGALQGADATYAGAFERANGGTLFLDELSELPLELQPRLLRAIERGEIQRMQGQAPVQVDVRVVAATSRDIGELVDQGKFRADLYYRLAEIRIDLPPLAERKEDIPVLVTDYFRRYAEQIAATGSKAKRLAPAALAQLQRYDFPGNVRELVNILRRGVAVAKGEEVLVGDLPVEVTGAKPKPGAVPPGSHQVLLLDATLPFKDAKAQILDAFERQYLIDLLQRHKLHISRAAREAGIDRRHLYRLLDKYGIEMKERELED
jgi:DNA-binding NtrC family response regulator